MKKLFLSMVLMAAALLVSCSGGSASSASAVAVKAYQAIASGDYEKVADCMFFDEDASAEDVAKGKEFIVAMMKEKIAPQFAEKGGIAKVESLGEELNEAGDEATVTLKCTFGDGSEETEDVELVKNAHGDWKIKEGK